MSPTDNREKRLSLKKLNEYTSLTKVQHKLVIKGSCCSKEGALAPFSSATAVQVVLERFGWEEETCLPHTW